jgi:hypothetical protein
MVGYNDEGGPPLSPDALQVIKALLPLPLSTIGDLAAVTGRPHSRLRSGLDELEDAELVVGAVLGWTLRGSPRWFLTDKALAGFDSSAPTWHEEGNRGELLHRLPLVEWFYRVAGSVRGLGRFEDFQWLDEVDLDAAVEYEKGWVAICWSGPLENESSITKRLERLGPDLLKLAATDEPPWPAAVFFVVTDPWQRELVYRAVLRIPWAWSTVSIWSIADGNPAEVQVDPGSHGGLHQPAKRRGVGGWPWAKRTEDSLWAQNGSQALGKVLAALAQWPDMTTRMGRQVLGEGDAGRSAQRCFTRLVQLGLAQRREEKGRYRYFLTDRGYALLTRRDGVPPRTAESKRDDPDKREKLKMMRQAHEDGLMSIMGQFMAAGLPVAEGRRSWEHLGHGGIAPDGMVFLEHGPYRRGWHYVEYELSARAERRVSEKLRGYLLSDRRQDNFPVLVVSWNDSAEAVFQQLGRESRLPMLTTTKCRLELYGPLGHPDCWSRYGERVTIG